MKSIHTLISDIYYLLEERDGRFNEDIARDFSQDLARSLVESLGEERRDAKPVLRLSGMGPKCPCALWYSIHHPELAEPMPAWAQSKFAFGTILEHFGIALCRAAGHTVEGEQDELVVDGIKGHRDGVVDGCIVDFKSCSSRAFLKFKTGSIVQDDPFGYLDQLDGYLVGSLHDPLVKVKDKAYIFAIDKTLGHMCLYEHRLREDHIRSRISEYKRIVQEANAPVCTCGTKKQGVSGNIQLDVRASYSNFKHCCFPNLRTFLYADGPVYLTEVKKVPNVHEIVRYNHSERLHLSENRQPHASTGV